MPDNSQDSTIAHNLDAIDRKIIELIISEPTLTDTEIGKIIGYGRETVNKRKNKPEVQEQIKDFQMSAIQMIVDLQPKAIKRLDGLIDSIDETIALNASKEIIKSLQTQKIELDATLKGDAEKPIAVVVGRRRIKGEYEESGNNKEA